MPRNVYEVLVGPATLYTAALGTAFPADPSVSPTGFTEIGYSDGGWIFAVDQKMEGIMVEEELDPLYMMRSALEVHIRGTVAQGSCEVLQLALGGGTITTAAGPPATKTYAPPLITDLPVEIAILLRGKAPAVLGVAKTRDIKVTRGMNMAAVEYTSKKAPQKSMLAQDWRALRPIAGGNTFTWTDLT